MKTNFIIQVLQKEIKVIMQELKTIPYSESTTRTSLIQKIHQLNLTIKEQKDKIA